VVTRVRRAVGSPIPHTGKHAFLESLHDLLRPATYLEIGVQFGNSLWLTRPETVAIGVDPAPLCVPPPNATIYPMTSDRFFEEVDASTRGLDLAFIDGSHLVEGALRDFIGVERHARPDGRTVAVFDDVLPYSAAIAGRTPLPGDWAGDCWKVVNALQSTRADLRFILVDVAPTGALVVLGLDPANTMLTHVWDHLMEIYVRDMDAPDHFITRDYAVPPSRALDLIREYLHITEA
jgi:hypothetical protein